MQSLARLHYCGIVSVLLSGSFLHCQTGAVTAPASTAGAAKQALPALSPYASAQSPEVFGTERSVGEECSFNGIDPLPEDCGMDVPSVGGLENLKEKVVKGTLTAKSSGASGRYALAYHALYQGSGTAPTPAKKKLGVGFYAGLIVVLIIVLVFVA